MCARDERKGPSAPWGSGYSTVTSTIITSFSKGQTFAQWMQLVGGLINASPPEMTITSPRYDFSSVVSPALEWMYANAGTAKPGPANPQFPLHYTFDTPWQQPSTCGRVIFSDFHVANAASTGLTFPAECTTGPMTPQEKALEYMIWDLASCVPPPPSPSCTPQTCAQQNIQCGPAGDGCGNLLNCGTCQAPQTCGGGGQSGKCGSGGNCTPLTCSQLGYTCGQWGDGCGNIIDCGQCTSPDTCGGGGVTGQCGAPK